MTADGMALLAKRNGTMPDGSMLPPPGNWKGWPWDFSAFPHDNYGPPVNYGIWLLTILALLFLSLRIYCKFLRHRGLWWDDHILVVSWIALAAQSALITYNTTIGYGQHIWDFFPEDLPTFLLVSNTSGFFSIIAAMASKTSFAITVLRISEGWIRRTIIVVIILTNLILGFGAASTYLQCTPVEKLWNPAMAGTCWPKETIIRYNIFTAAFSGAMDIVLAILPWKIIWPLTMNKTEKIGVLLAMNMGVFAGVMSLAKITQLPAINKFDLIDGIWLSILGTAESAITIMAASIPVLRALVRSTPMRPPPLTFYRGGLDGNAYSADFEASPIDVPRGKKGSEKLMEMQSPEPMSPPKASMRSPAEQSKKWESKGGSVGMAF